MFFPAPTPDTDPLCRLTDANKLRLCASVYASRTFRREKVNFEPTTDNVDVECVTKEIRVVSPETNRCGLIAWRIRKNFNPFRIYKEWMIGCRATTEQGVPIISYVCRAHFQNSVFVFKPSDSNEDERVSVFNYFANVSVADTLQENRWPRSFLINDVED